MAGPSADRITEWEGGTLGELVSVLQAAALPVRIEVIAPGATGSTAGEVHLLAGGLADAFAGSLRRDDAVAALQRLEGARFIVECRLPEPGSGSLSEAGPSTGSLSDRPLAALMRYCEEYVLSCRLEVWRGDERAVITYRRGEIVSTTVGGADGSERLPEVLAWTEGSYEISLPAPVLPHIPGRTRESLVTRPSERRRHSTLPMMSATDAKGEAGAKPDAKPAPIATTPPARPQTTPPPVRVPPRPSVVSTPAPSAGTAPVAPMQPEMTARGTPPVPMVPLHPAPAAGRPTLQGPGTAAQPAPGPASKPAVGPQPPQARPPVATPAAAKPAAPASVSAAPAKPAAPAPAPAKPASAVAPAPAKPAQAPAAQAPAAPVVVAQAQPAAKPVAPPAKPAQPQPAAQANGSSQGASARPKTGAASSNDLMPASGTIEAKPKHANNLPPSTAPIQIADQPGQAIVTTPAQPPAPSPVPAAAPSRPVEQQGRQRIAARKRASLHPVRAYVFVGLAIGIGIVLAYWAYWYLPFGHH